MAIYVSKCGDILKIRRFQFSNISINIVYIHDLIFLKSVLGVFCGNEKHSRTLKLVLAEIRRFPRSGVTYWPFSKSSFFTVSQKFLRWQKFLASISSEKKLYSSISFCKKKSFESDVYKKFDRHLELYHVLFPSQ